MSPFDSAAAVVTLASRVFEKYGGHLTTAGDRIYALATRDSGRRPDCDDEGKIAHEAKINARAGFPQRSQLSGWYHV